MKNTQEENLPALSKAGATRDTLDEIFDEVDKDELADWKGKAFHNILFNQAPPCENANNLSTREHI